MKKKHESISIENCRKHGTVEEWLGFRERWANPMCWEGAKTHGLPDDWEGTVSVSLTQFPHGKGHKVGIKVNLSDGVAIMAGDKTFRNGITLWLAQTLRTLGHDSTTTEFYVAFKGKNGRYVKCPW